MTPTIRVVWSCPTLAIVLGLGVLSTHTPAAFSHEASQADATISPAIRQPDGLLVHAVRCSHQSGPTRIRVLVPDKMVDDTRYRVVYVLPVEAGDGTRYGDGLATIRKLGLHNRRQLIFVAPTFSDLPWYADHPTDPEIHQESYLLRVVLPLVEKTYPVRAERKGRLLLGFSKSGWGAFSLLLRHPDTFARAAAWDAPLMEDRPVRFGMGPIFGTQENFERYRITRLLRRRAPELRGKPPCLILTGYGNFRDQHIAAHKLMTELEIPHEYRDGPGRKHTWESGWLPEAVALLAGRD